MEQVLELAERQGYTLPAEELDGELDEAELETVSGGWSNTSIQLDGVIGETTISLSYSPGLNTTSGTNFGSNLFLKIG